MKKKEVFEEIALLLGVDEVDTTDKKWFGVRTTAICNIMDRMTAAELREVDAEVEKIGREGYSIPQKQLNATKHCTKRFEVSVLHHWLEMGVLSVSIAAYLNSSSQHENAAETVGIKMYETFQERHREKLQEIKQLWIDYICEVLDCKNGSFVGPAKDNITHVSGARTVDSSALKLGYSEDGYPQLPSALEIDKLKKTPGCALLCNYLAQNYCEDALFFLQVNGLNSTSGLATCLQSDQVPYTAISESATAQNQFIEPKYLPLSFRLADPHNLKVERIREFFNHIKLRESQYPPSEVFCFRNVHSTRRKGEVVPTKYPGEFDAANPPFVKRKAARRQKKPKAAAQTHQSPASVDLGPSQPNTISRPTITNELLSPTSVDLGSSHPNTISRPIITNELQSPGSVDLGLFHRNPIPRPTTTHEFVAAYASAQTGLVAPQCYVSTAVHEQGALRPAQTTEQLVLDKMLRFDPSFLDNFDEPDPYLSAHVGSSQEFGLGFGGGFNMLEPQNFDRRSDLHRTPTFNTSFFEGIHNRNTRVGSGQYTPSCTPFEHSTSTGLPTPCLTPDTTQMSRLGPNPRSLLQNQQLARIQPDQPHHAQFVTPELLSPMGTLSPLNQTGLPMPIQAQFSDLRAITPFQHEYGVPRLAHGNNEQQHGAMHTGMTYPQQGPVPMSLHADLSEQTGPTSADLYLPTDTNPYRYEYPLPTFDQGQDCGQPMPPDIGLQSGYPMPTAVKSLEHEQAVRGPTQQQIAVQPQHRGQTTAEVGHRGQTTAEVVHRGPTLAKTAIPAEAEHPVGMLANSKTVAQHKAPVPKTGITAQHEAQEPLQLQGTSTENVRAKRLILTADARAITEAEIVLGKRKQIPKKQG